MEIRITKHFAKRFRERVSRTKRMPEIVKDAYCFGVSVDQMKNRQLRKEIDQKQEVYSTKAVVYKNVVYWFCQNRAITVYPLPQKDHGKAMA